MKKFLLLFSIAASGIAALAQEPADALRYSWYVPGASARIQAVGGAMTSLGGDLTAAFVNPAGLAFYRTGDFLITPMYRFGKTDATYYGRENREKSNLLTWGTSGVVLGGGDGQGKVRNVSLALGFNRTADFSSYTKYFGQNNQSSFSQQYVEQIGTGGTPPKFVAEDRGFRFGPGLALLSGWIDTTAGTGPNYQYRSVAQGLATSTGLLQLDSVEHSGGIYEFALGGAVNLQDKLMLGASIGVPILDYHRHRKFIEADATDDSLNRFDFAQFTEDYRTKGVGLNVRLGLIYKPAEFWRLGFAFQSPTIYSLTDTYVSSITANTEKFLGTQTFSSDDAFYQQAYGDYRFKYRLITPYRVSASVSYVLREIQDVTKQRGFITADVEYVNHKATTYMTDEEDASGEGTKQYLDALNSAIDNTYKGAFNFRGGMELKFTTIMVRAGVAYYGNPYKDLKGEYGDRLNLSGGLGYRNKGFFIDLTYVHSMGKDVNYSYRLQNGNYSAAALRNVNGQILATLGVKF